LTPPSPLGRQARGWEQVQKWINTHTDQAIVVLSLVVGCWLLGDSIYLIVS
jgi:hypothetical protein